MKACINVQKQVCFILPVVFAPTRRLGHRDVADAQLCIIAVKNVKKRIGKYIKMNAC